MAKQSSAGATKPGIVTRVKDFFREVKSEMGKVAWPTKDEVKDSTSVVLTLLVIIAAIIGVYDLVFQRIMMLLLSLGSA